MNHRLIAALAAAGLLLAVPAVAAGPEHLTVEEILVTDSAADSAATLTVSGKSIEKGKKFNVADAIMNEPDVTSTRRAAVGDNADSLAIRGLSGNRIMLNINGRPVNSSGVVGGHYIDWGTIPLDNIERIEVIRGGSSVRYGNNALGGVINVITRKPSATPRFTVFSSIGAGEGGYLVQNHRFTDLWKIGPVGYSLAGSFQKADEYLWNNDFTGKNLSLTLEFDMPLAGLMSLGLQYSDDERGFIINNRKSDDPDNPAFNTPIDPDYPTAFGETFSPYSGNAFAPGPGAVWDKSKYYLDFGYSQPIGEGLAELKLYKNIEDRDEKNYSRAGLVPGYGDGRLVLDRSVESDRSSGGSLTYSQSIGDHDILAGIDHQDLAYGDVTINYIDSAYNNFGWFGPKPSSHPASAESLTWGYFVEDSWRAAEPFLLTLGLRYDTYENKAINGSTAPSLKDEALTPKLTATWEMSGADRFTLSLYQAMRTPGLPETYWWYNGATGGSPALKAEKNNAAELVYRRGGLPGHGYIRLSGYYYDIHDYIMFRFDPTWRGAYNIDKAVLHGLSADGRVGIGDLTLRGSLAYQHSRKHGDIYDTAHLSDAIDYLPEWKAGLGADLALPLSMVLSADLRHVGKREAIYAWKSGWPARAHFRLATLGAYTTVDLNLKARLGSEKKKAELSLFVENLFDKGYEERFGYPMPGRMIGASFKAAF